MADILRSAEPDPDRLLLEETLYHSSNGYLGVRGCFEEGYPAGIRSVRGTYVNAFYDTHPIHHPERLFGFPEVGERILNVPDAQTIVLEVDGERVLLEGGRFSRYERALDADLGISRRSFEWSSSGGARIEVSIRRLASLARRELFAVEYSVRSLDREVSLAIESRLEGEVENAFDANDPRLSGKAFKALEVAATAARADERGGELFVLARTLGRGAELAAVSLVEVEEGPSLSSSASSDASGASLALRLRLGPGGLVRMSRKNVYADSDRSGDAARAAREAARELRGRSFADIAAEHSRALAERWPSAEASVEGDESVAEALRFDLFQLIQSAPADDRGSVPAKGLSGEGYEGHYFWDAEIYMAPFYVHTDPAAARRMLMYRHSTLDRAREHARAMGQARGALFPWRTIAGRECSAYYPSGSAQYHIDADVAYAAWKYYEATEDLGFLRGAGAELLFETARLWIEVGHWAGGRFRIDAVTGPDEYACVVDNSYYTNAMARFNLRRALDARAILASRDADALSDIERRIGLEPREPAAWEEASDRMYLPYDPVLDVNAQDETFLGRAEWDFAGTPPEDYPLLLSRHHLDLRRHQVCKQADVVLAHFLLPGIAAESTVRSSYAYYERRTTHDSSLSYAVFAAMAARLGDAEKAYRYFMRTVRLDLDDVQGNTKDGIHAANLGGTWLALAMGFGGLSVDGAVPSLAPILPERWKGLSFAAAFRGSRMIVRASRGADGGIEASVELASGPELDVALYGERRRLRSRIRGSRP